MKITKIKSILILMITLILAVISPLQIAAASATNTDAKYYSNFTTSPAYKNFSILKSYKSSRTAIIPGLKNTNVAGTNCSTMTPQGLCIAGDYMLISAYDSSKKCNSVVYVLNNSTLKYITTLVLPSKIHAGGVAYDGTNVWICNNSSLSCIKYSTIKSAANSKPTYKKVSWASTKYLGITASFVTYYNSKLWVGTFNEKSDQNMYSYSVKNKTSSAPTLLSAINRMTVPDRTQGVAFCNGYMIVTRSLRQNMYKSDYISVLRVYKPSFSNPTSSGFIYKNNAVKTTKLPPMAEGVVMNSTNTYILFESAAKVYSGCTNKYYVDRVVAFNTSTIIR